MKKVKDEPITSGYFIAHVIDIPPGVITDRKELFQQVEPHASFVQIIHENDYPTYSIDFWGDEKGALILFVMPDSHYIKILMPIGSNPGDYSFRAYMYKPNTSDIKFQVDGSFTIDSALKADCGCIPMGRLNDERYAPSVPEDQVAFEAAWEITRASR